MRGAGSYRPPIVRKIIQTPFILSTARGCRVGIKAKENTEIRRGKKIQAVSKPMNFFDHQGAFC
jgi:hypothetical protein